MNPLTDKELTAMSINDLHNKAYEIREAIYNLEHSVYDEIECNQARNVYEQLIKEYRSRK